MRGVTALCFAVFLNGSALLHAQVGKGMETFVTVWGPPVEADSTNPTNRRVCFRKGNTTVEAFFMEGVAKRITYGGNPEREEWISTLLQLNSDGLEWHPWNPPKAQSMSENPRKRWTRADEEAMAELIERGLCIMGVGWNSELLVPTEKETETNDIKGPGEPEQSPSAEESLRPTHADPLPPQGFWLRIRDSSKGSLQQSLQISKEGLIIWRDHTPENPRMFKTTAIFIPSSDDQSKWMVRTIQGHLVGTLRVTSEGFLQFEPAQQVGDDPQPDGFLREPSLFQMAGCQKADGEEGGSLRDLPRTEVLQRYGSPMGTMRSGAQEVFLYPWGNVFFRNGKVEKIETRGTERERHAP